MTIILPYPVNAPFLPSFKHLPGPQWVCSTPRHGTPWFWCSGGPWTSLWTVLPWREKKPRVAYRVGGRPLRWWCCSRDDAAAWESSSEKSHGFWTPPCAHKQWKCLNIERYKFLVVSVREVIMQHFCAQPRQELVKDSHQLEHTCFSFIYHLAATLLFSFWGVFVVFLFCGLFFLNPHSADYPLSTTTIFLNFPKPWPKMVLFLNCPKLLPQKCHFSPTFQNLCPQ